MNIKEFGLFFAQAREESGYESQRQLALASGVSNGTIARIEAGTQKPTPETLRKLAPLLKAVNYEDLMIKSGYISDNPEITADKVKINNNDKSISVAGQELTLTQDELKVFEELKKHPILFHDLASDPEKKIKELIKLQKMKKLFLDDDEDKNGDGFGELDD